MSFIAGRYTATFNGLSLGQTAEGYRLSHQLFKRVITGDAYGDTPQDAVYRGATAEISYRLLEYNAAGARAAFWPVANGYLDIGIVGRLDVGSGLAKSLILTSIQGTPAAGAPASITLPLVALKEGFPVELLFAPDLREVPMLQRCYPNESGLLGAIA